MNIPVKADLLPRLTLPLAMLVLGIVVGAWAFGAADGGSGAEPMAGPVRPAADASRPTAPTAATGQAGQGQWQDLVARLEQETRARRQLAEEVAALHERVEALSVQLAAVEGAPADTAVNRLAVSDDAVLTEASLVAAGLPEAQAGEIVRRQAEWEMRRLELQDEARRGGWLFTERYYEAVEDLGGGIADMRAELGEELYDRYLYASGQPNRVAVASVIDGSPAAQAGIEPGDVIVSYAGARQFAWSSLRSATSEGSRGEYVTVRVQRDGRDLELLVPRGPLGVRLQMVRLDPRGERDG